MSFLRLALSFSPISYLPRFLKNAGDSLYSVKLGRTIGANWPAGFHAWLDDELFSVAQRLP